MACQRPQDDAELSGLRVGIVDVDVVFALSHVGGIGQEPKPRVSREPRGSKGDQLLPRSVAGNDPVRCRQVRIREEHHTIIPENPGNGVSRPRPTSLVSAFPPPAGEPMPGFSRSTWWPSKSPMVVSEIRMMWRVSQRLGWHAAALPLRNAWQLRRMKFTGALTNCVTVPAGPAGRPGEQVRLPSRSPYIGVINADDSRSDFFGYLSQNGSAINAVVFRAELTPSTPQEHAMFAISSMLGMGAVTLLEAPRPEAILGQPGVRYSYRLNSGNTVNEWKFIRDGWMYALGMQIVPRDDPEVVEQMFKGVIDTWIWSKWADGRCSATTPAPPAAG